ncbi:hypothetical protein C5O00_10035 [Pukyongia salina]|uniref:C1q domain-containing protein n=1 Tax=Pukyongia salina TaxID=2094025 RepID=A0A2S0HXW5_9FLAO|nr:hypothetical protein [Pukyongia salina]AVI51492.1 hypothetical protein C5O00_10035 [Pukyongia salina]
MKSLLIGFFLVTLPLFGQVGIGTTAPVAQLDINGDVIIREITTESNAQLAKDSLLITNAGLVKKISAEDLIDATLPTAVKGNFSSGGLINVSLLTGSIIIPFDSEDFDMGGEYDTTTYTYTATDAGIFDIYVQIEADATIGIATNFGVKIMHNGVVAQRNSFANVGVLGANVTPPLRSVRTLLQLNIGDTINFEVEGDIALGSVNLIGNDLDSFFTIHQVR